MVSLLTCEPGGVDIVRPLVVVCGAEEDSVTVSGQEVRAPVLALVTDPQCRAVLGLTGVVGADQLKEARLITSDSLCFIAFSVRTIHHLVFTV